MKMKHPIFMPTSSLFNKQTKKDWNKIQKNKNLEYKYDDFVFDPIYFKQDIAFTNTFNNNSNWDICAEVIIKNEKQANKDALAALNFGANSICFLNFKNHDLNIILKHIQIDVIKLDFKHIYNLERLIDKLIQIGLKKSANLKKLTGCFYTNSITKTSFETCLKTFL